jgi:HAD superfamily hydrolase (TIGR01549 family)
MKFNTSNAAKSYRAILFDFEGTLVDFQWNIDEAVEELLAVLAALGFDQGVFSKYDYATLFNRAMEESKLLRLPSAVVLKKIGEVYDRFDMDAAKRWTPKEDAKYVLENLMKEGVLTGLVTNAGRKAISILLERFDFKRLLNVVITRNDVSKLKPHGESILKAIHTLKAKKREALFVGDSVTDIKATEDAGVDVALVLGGESNRIDVEKYKPKFILYSLSEVLKVI